MIMTVVALTIAGLGAGGVIASVVLEAMLLEPVFLILAKVGAGILGVGGLVFGVLQRKR